MQFVQFLLSCMLFISCNTSSEKTSSNNNINNEPKVNTIKLNIKSPSDTCIYEFVINSKGEGFYYIIKRNVIIEKKEIQITDDKDNELLHNLINSFKVKEKYEGKLWKDGWKYTVFLNESKIILIYKKQESKDVIDLIELFKKYAKTSIDYNCF